MGKAVTLLEALCGHALSLGAVSIEVEYRDGRDWVIIRKGRIGIGIADYKSSSADAKELRGNLYAAAKKRVRTVIGGQTGHLRQIPSVNPTIWSRRPAPDLALSDHVHRLVACHRSQRALDGAEPGAGRHALPYKAMILPQYMVQVGDGRHWQ